MEKRKRKSVGRSSVLGDDVLSSLDGVLDPEMLADNFPVPSEELCAYIHAVAQYICVTTPKRRKCFRTLHPSALVGIGFLLQNLTSYLLEPVVEGEAEDEGNNESDESPIPVPVETDGTVGELCNQSGSRVEDASRTYDSEGDAFDAEGLLLVCEPSKVAEGEGKNQT